MTRASHPGAPRQRGIAMLAVLVVVLVVLGGYLLYDTLRDNPELAGQTRATPRLAEAREALIGRAKSQWCLLQTGNVVDHLPCPDTGTAEGEAAATCAGTVVGRLPWKTLGLPALRDAAGECLWYERSATGARVIAPGVALPGQSRDGTGAAPECGGSYDGTQYAEGGNDIVLTIALADLAAPSGCSAAPPPPPPPPGPDPDCVAAADVLLGKVSGYANNCRVFPNKVDPACSAAANQLAASGCTCAPAGNVFINPPCRNSLHPPACQAAIASMQSCE